MSGKIGAAFLAVGALVLGGVVGPGQFATATAPSAGNSVAAAGSKGRVSVRIRTPQGIPATVALVGVNQRVVTKRAKGTVKSVTIRLLKGRYRVQPNSVTLNGRLFTAKSSRKVVQVRRNRIVKVKVRYQEAVSAYQLHTTGIGKTSIDLIWGAPAGATFELRRTVGDVPATTRTEGTAVTIQGTQASDSGLEPGTQYAYALFTQVAGRWKGPLTAVAGTMAREGSGTAAYVAAANTLIAETEDTRWIRTTGDGVRLKLAAGIPAPVIGSAMVLPRSAALPGGFLGRVTSISANGRVVDLKAGGIADAFDFYAISVDDFGARTTALSADPRPAMVQTVDRTKKLSALPNCLGGSGSQQITFSPSISLGGHFTGVISKYEVNTYLFGSYYVMTGASIDTKLTATVTGALAVQVNGALKCGIPFTPVMTPIATAPVPVSFYFTPVAEVSVGGAVELSNLGMTVTAGVQFAGTISVTKAPSFSGSPVFSVSPLTPVVTANANVGLTLGGEVIVGPGSGTPGAGVIAGVGGKLNPLDAKFGPVFTASDSRVNACLKAEAAFTRELNLSVKAWLGNFDVSRSITIDALKGSTQYPGSPWFYPSDCTTLPPDPGGDVIGEGLDLVDDFTSGSNEQWGHLDGFALGSATWVLSTGKIAEAVGSPSTLASTDMLQPGNTALGALVGNSTHDAATYRARVIPHADTLHIRYLFASEEYPEFVGSVFNDVMAVFVDGVNCAVAPGTTTPVSVNTINQTTNSSWYIDNASGAAGYATTFDGLTRPLTCDVPVTPGQQVTIEVGVADTKDSIFDSAVALLDKGIWAD